MDSRVNPLGSPTRALLLIDRPVLAELVKLALSHGRFLTRVVQTPQEASAVLAEWRPHVAIIVIGLSVWAIFAYSEPVLLTMALTYTLSGIILRITSKLRPHPPAPEEVHAA